MENNSPAPFEESQLTDDPLELFGQWYEDAKQSNPVSWQQVDAVTLATTDRDGGIHARIVLHKIATSDGLVFFTNYDSDKSLQLVDVPRAALVFHWHHRGRQIRVEGTVERTDRPLSEKYFHSRHRGSQISAHASDQSHPLESRDELEKRFHELEARFGDGEIPLPENWGGFLVKPEMMEFWQSGKYRLHDRFRYVIRENQWRVARLAP